MRVADSLSGSLRCWTCTALFPAPFAVSQTSTEVPSSHVMRTDRSGVALRTVSLTPGSHLARERATAKAL